MALSQASNKLSTLLGSANLNPFQKKSATRGSVSACITRSIEKRKWEEIQNAETALLRELQEMFWAGVRRELVEIIRTLKAWRDDDALKDVELEEEKDCEICGFDTFIDQVSESSREFAVDYGAPPSASSFPLFAHWRLLPVLIGAQLRRRLAG